MQEIWKKVIGYEAFYEVSNLGNVKSLNRKGRYIRNNREVFYSEKGKNIKPNLSGRYARIALTAEGKTKHFSVHRLVALAFIPNIEYKLQVNHKNGNKFDNSVENLEWATASENTKHAYQTGLININNVGKHNIGILPVWAKSVVDLQTGIFYDSIKSAEIAKCITPNTLKAKLRGVIPNRTDIIYC